MTSPIEGRQRARGIVGAVGIAGLAAAVLLAGGGLHPAPAANGSATSVAAEPRSGVHVITSGLNSERRRAIRITRRPRGGQQVVMSLHPHQLGPLLSGHGVEGRAELEVSTNCLTPQPTCIGRRYGFNPMVSARLVLAPGPRVARGPNVVAVSRWHRKRCWQRPPNRNHHCVLAIPGAARVIEDASSLPCASHCYLNLVANAHHRRAKRGHRLVIGISSRDSRGHDKGQLAAVVFRPWAVRDLGAVLGTAEVREAVVPVGPNRRGAARRRVIYSLRLDDLRAGEQLAVDARAVADIGHLSYNTLVQARLILSRAPDVPVRAGPPRAVGSFQGRFGAQNGFNCTQGRSGHSTPCEVRKTGVMRILRDARERPRRDEGERIPLYVNLVVGTRSIGGHEGRRREGDELRVGEGGFIRVIRYGTELGP
jgi:hypothetical protein